jgi:hypothetical protein
VSPAVAAAGFTTSVSAYTEGEYIGYYGHELFRSGSSEIEAQVVNRVLNVSAVLPGDTDVEFEFSAPNYEHLKPGNYLAATRESFKEFDEPGIDISSQSRGCNTIFGEFELRDLLVGPRGRVDRLWLLYEQHCEGRIPAFFGEIRINTWNPTRSYALAPGVVRWPRLDPWREAPDTPVNYRGRAAVKDVTIRGPAAAHFTADSSACADGARRCDIVVGYKPSSPGIHEAALKVTDARGRVHETILQGFLHGGTTQADFEVLAGDDRGTPGQVFYGPQDAQFAGVYGDGEARFYLETPDLEDWAEGRFGAPEGSELVPGHYPNADDDLYTPGPSMWVYGPTECSPGDGEFTVHSIGLMPDETLRTFDVSFVENCDDNGEPGLRGRLQWRAGDDGELPNWLEPGERPRLEVPGGDVGWADCSYDVLANARVRTGTADDDRLAGGRRMDLLSGLDGNDRLASGAGRDCLHGGNGHDRLAGGAGNDVLVGGRGRDTLDCGRGRDRAIAGGRERVSGCERVERV